MVENSAAANYLQQVLPALTQYLRQGLKNDDVVVKFIVNTAVNVKPRAYSPREIFQEMLKKNEAFKKLAMELRLEVLSISAFLPTFRRTSLKYLGRSCTF